jgi:hypothetical protein
VLVAQTLLSGEGDTLIAHASTPTNSARIPDAVPLPPLQVLVAQTLLSGEGDTLIAIQSLIGAVGMTAFTYFMPYILLILITPTPLSRPRLCWFYFNIAMGVVVMFGGLASSMDDLISSSTGLFAGTCTLSFAYSPTSPEDPCFVSRLPVNVTGQTEL